MNEETIPTPLVVYKKWSRGGGIQRFCSISPWLDKLKCSIEIGQSKPEGGLASATKCWVDLLEFHTFLNALRDCNATTIYGAVENFMYYGGANVEGKDIARVVSIKPWTNASKDVDPFGFEMKCTHLVGDKTAQGAFMPKRPNTKLSEDSIKMTRSELAVAANNLTIAINGYAARNPDWPNYNG